MNQKELNEIRRRFKPDRTAISKVYGCYVSSARQIISYIDAPMGLMSQEEQEMFLNLLEKSLSGALGRNLIDIVFSTAQVADSDEHRLLQTLRQTALQDPNAREMLYRRIIDSIDMGDSSYLILLAADAYDVPRRGSDDQVLADGSDTVFKYFVCSICPVKDPTLALRYSDELSEFHSCSTGHIASPPELGFLFPAFDDRAANIYNALFTARTPRSCIRRSSTRSFTSRKRPCPPRSRRTSSVRLSATCSSASAATMSSSPSTSSWRGRIQEHKESHDPEPLELSVREVGEVLSNSGVPSEKAEAFEAKCRRQYGENAALNPKNLIEAGKFQVTTPEVKITVSPEYSYMVEARVIDGRKYILIPADENVEVNGITVNIPNPQTAEEI